ncbi:ABC transporter substrate-binding protein [Amycolatopsis taiwanensis]|uniref:Peptide ABC transporter substrate-binding protein n=1 Tax=Amycolatopsis taiwanensis TaxID=342230 RepID=A0A9W6RAB0_9PSEU|nr:ABC transporter substrate-binding protein [Amycolatopsis taiwanensis]GLY70422.1 peptide ABC transporter substrate-binding protein [Amycolatopsis taiwanensis]
MASSMINRSRSITAMAGLAVSVVTAGAALAGCGSGGSSAGGTVVNGGTFTYALSSDPGNLDPQSSVSSNAYSMSVLAYDPLLSIDDSGAIGSQLAASWHVNDKTVTLTMRPGITCSDGSAFTAQTAADNLNYVGNPKNSSPFAGVMLPVNTTATADAATDTVTINLPGPAPFILNGLAGIPMVCANGMADRKLLAGSTNGTGAYQLTQAQPGNQYTLTKRADYTWGPNGATTAQPGQPDKIVVKIIANETTAANLLLSGQINAATILGQDAKRLESSRVDSVNTSILAGELWFNHAPGRAGADQKVRLALTQAVDLGQLQKVLTSGEGEPATALAVVPPAACKGNSVAEALPEHNLDQAKALLDSAGWTMGQDGVRTKDGQQLALTFVYASRAGAAASAAADLAAGQWQQLGVKVTPSGQDNTTQTNTLFSTGNWDIALGPVNVPSPDQLVGFLSGPVPPNGDNFAHIDNAAYTSLVDQAQRLEGSAGCPQWLAAESSLIKNADVIPFANQLNKVFASGARFSAVGQLVPTSIRMTSN